MISPSLLQAELHRFVQSRLPRTSLLLVAVACSSITVVEGSSLPAPGPTVTAPAGPNQPTTQLAPRLPPAGTVVAAPAGAPPAALAGANLGVNPPPAGGFVPGGRELFATDFSQEPIGGFPQSLRQLRGSMSVVEKDGKRMLRATNNAEFLISLPERLPEHFTVEFDLVTRVDYNTEEIAFEGTPAFNRGPASANILWYRTDISILGGREAGHAYIKIPADVAAELAGQPAEFRADINGGTVTLYANGRRITSVPDVKFVRGRVLRIFLGGEDAKLNAVHLSRVRIADASTAAPAGAKERSESRMAASAAAQRVTQAFTLFAREGVSLAVPVAGPGPVDVQVDARGGALSALLIAPDGRTTRQNGTGTLKLRGESTAAAGGEAELWRVLLQEANPPKTLATVPAAPQPFATGSITVQAPRAPDPAARVAAEKRRDLKKRELASLPLRSQDDSAMVTALQAQWSQQTAARHTALLERTAPLLPVAVTNLAKQSIAGRSLGLPPPEPLAWLPVTPVQSATPTQLIALNQLSVSEGDPGTPVVIDGTGFGDTVGEVHFQVSAEKDLVGRVLNWTPTRILVEVPDVSGVSAYDGSVYVKARGLVSARKPFKFLPELVYQTLRIPGRNDVRLSDGGEWYDDHIHHDCFLFFFQASGYDEFYISSTLKNGWVVESASAKNTTGYVAELWNPFPVGLAYIAEYRPGTASPYIKVRWWSDALNFCSYSISIVVKGPKGLPFF